MEGGGAGIEDTVLFGKYRICRVIGSGRVGTVFLAVHIELEEYRAIKRVSKDHLEYAQFRKEALILKDLHDPGIPIVYDLEEDAEFSYLIEEYLEGESLYDLVHLLGYLPAATVVQYGIQICHIVNHLHSAGTFPILHLDLQPKNLLLCHEIIKLIDFDHAASVADANLTRVRYGTAGCAAPEQYTCEPLDERTDIYAIGVILHYLGTGVYPCDAVKGSVRQLDKELSLVISACLEPDKECRYQSASELQDQLVQLAGCRTGVFKHLQSSSLTIALTGSKSGVGTTHLAIGLSVYLKNHGFPNLYEEKNQSGAVAGLLKYFGAQADRKGLLRIKNCVMKPYYGKSVKLEDSRYQIVIQDYGTNWERIQDLPPFDMVILVCTGAWWDMDSLEKAIDGLKAHAETVLIFPRNIRKTAVKQPEKIRKFPCFIAPYFPDPFHGDPQADSFYETLLDKMLKQKGGTLRQKLGKRVLAIWKKIGEP